MGNNNNSFNYYSNYYNNNNNNYYNNSISTTSLIDPKEKDPVFIKSVMTDDAGKYSVDVARRYESSRAPCEEQERRQRDAFCDTTEPDNGSV